MTRTTTRSVPYRRPTNARPALTELDDDEREVCCYGETTEATAHDISECPGYTAHIFRYANEVWIDRVTVVAPDGRSVADLRPVRRVSFCGPHWHLDSRYLHFQPWSWHKRPPRELRAAVHGVIEVWERALQQQHRIEELLAHLPRAQHENALELIAGGRYTHWDRDAPPIRCAARISLSQDERYWEWGYHLHDQWDNGYDTRELV